MTIRSSRLLLCVVGGVGLGLASAFMTSAHLFLICEVVGFGGQFVCGVVLATLDLDLFGGFSLALLTAQPQVALRARREAWWQRPKGQANDPNRKQKRKRRNGMVNNLAWCAERALTWMITSAWQWAELQTSHRRTDVTRDERS